MYVSSDSKSHLCFVVIFFTMLCLVPPSTLFPYTTLFRSPVSDAATADEQKHAGGGDGRPDRKSTRLNSSHVANSYAVFCLKKKKVMQHSDQTLKTRITWSL